MTSALISFFIYLDLNLVLDTGHGKQVTGDMESSRGLEAIYEKVIYYNYQSYSVITMIVLI